MTLELTPEEIERYAPYHTMRAFAAGFSDYSENSCYGATWNDDGVNGQAYDRGAECAMRRARGAGR